jgi:Cu+-exporting ATPase
MEACMATSTTDLVCGMTVEDSAAAPRATHDGRSYVFCSTTCRDRFIADPDRYARTDSDPRA